MSLDQDIKKILSSDKPKSERDRELSKLGLRPADIRTIWFNFSHGKPNPGNEEDFRRRFPNAPVPEPRDTLNLILRKEFAHEIVSGEKTIEIREVSPFYTSRVYDKRVVAFLNEHPEVERDYKFYTPLREVKKIHFYSYSNTWHLDVECTAVEEIAVTRETVRHIQEAYNSHEFDELLEELERDEVPDNQRPQFFIFAIGKILDKKL